MASLVPCTACQRHIRHAEAQCPFCGAQRTPSAGPFREVVIPRHVKRATIFAIGLTLAGQACGGQSEGVNDPTPSGAGASIGTAGRGGRQTSGTGGTTNERGGEYGMPVPPYGLSPYYPGDGSGGAPDVNPSEDAGVTDAGRDADGDAGPDDDAGN
jgi:hypothetical protein